MASQLSPYRLVKAREVFNAFNIFNALSWNLLVGSIVTLFAMRLGASSTYIGLLNAAVYISFFFLPLGKALARRFSIIGVFSAGWTLRAVFMLTAAAAPFAAYTGRRDAALALTLSGVFAFHFFRGIGTVGNNPVLSQLASGPDRGSYLTQTQIVNSAVTMLGSFLVAMVLGREPPVYLYSVLFTAGVGCGIISGRLLKKVPEPPYDREGGGSGIVTLLRETFSQTPLRRFLLILFLVALVSGVSRAFVVVYAREVFGHNDGLVSLYTVFGGLGYLMIGLFIKFLVDRIGAKPIFMVCVIAGLASMLPVLFFPQSMIENVTGAVLFLSFLFFMLNFGFLGSEGIAQTYFMGLIPAGKMLDMGIVYFLVFGIAGAAGSLFAGLFLDMLSALGVSVFAAFKILFAIIIALSLIIIFLQRRLTQLGALPFMGALGVIFSLKDLRAISLLDKLNKTQDSREEEAILGALHDTPSQLAVRGLLEKARSPRLATRLESLRAMENLKKLGTSAEKALLDDITANPFTTAYISARILGNHGCAAALPLLRESISSSDYMLAGEAMIALARLGDETSRPAVERLTLKTENPRLKIMGVEALGIYRLPDSLPALLDTLREADPPPYLRDEVVLAMSAILDTQTQFYPILVRFAADQSLTAALAMDEAESAFEFYRSNLGRRQSRKNSELARIAEHAKSLQPAASAYISGKDGAELSRWILELPAEICGGIAQPLLSEAVMDADLAEFNRLRLLIVHWSAFMLRSWVKRLK